MAKCYLSLFGMTSGNHAVRAMLLIASLCAQSCVAAEISDAELAKKLHLKNGAQIIRKGGKRMLLTPLDDDMVQHLLKMEERIDKIRASVPTLDLSHKPSQKLYTAGKEDVDENHFDDAIPKFSQYIADFQKESEKAPKESKESHDYYLGSGYEWRAYSYLQEKDYKSAIADLTEAIKLRPTNAFAYSNRAKAYRMIGADERAQADEKKLQSLIHFPRGRRPDMRPDMKPDMKTVVPDAGRPD